MSRSMAQLEAGEVPTASLVVPTELESHTKVSLETHGGPSSAAIFAAVLHFPEADGRDQRIQRASRRVLKQILHCKPLSRNNDIL